MSSIYAQKHSNRIFAHVRHGPSRTRADYETVSRRIVEAWDGIAPVPQARRSAPPPDFELRMVMFLGAITAVYEAGFMMPEAGGDRDWVRENLEAFEKRAREGDEEFAEMVGECRERGLV